MGRGGGKGRWRGEVGRGGVVNEPCRYMLEEVAPRNMMQYECTTLYVMFPFGNELQKVLVKTSFLELQQSSKIRDDFKILYASELCVRPTDNFMHVSLFNKMQFH